MFLCARLIPQLLLFFSLSNIHSSIFIRQEANWIWDCFDATHLAFSETSRWCYWVLSLPLVGEWVWDLTIMQVTEALWSWGSSQAEGLKETVLFVPQKKKGAGRGIFFLLRKWCSAPVVRGQKNLQLFAQMHCLLHLTCFCCLRALDTFEGYNALRCQSTNDCVLTAIVQMWLLWCCVIHIKLTPLAIIKCFLHGHIWIELFLDSDSLSY